MAHLGKDNKENGIIIRRHVRKTSACKVMANVFWDSKGIFLVEFLERCATILSERYVQKSKKLKQRFSTFRLPSSRPPEGCTPTTPFADDELKTRRA